MIQQTKKLGEICEFARGLTYSKGDEVLSSNNAVLRASNVNYLNNTLDLSEIRYIKNSFEIPENKKVRKGSLLICTASGSKEHLGKVALIDKEYNFAFGGFMGQISPKKDVDSKYLYYFFVSPSYKQHILKLTGGTNINNLKFSDIENIEIPFLPLTKQKRIVKILDEVFEKIEKAKENTEKNLQNSKEIFESYLNNIFSNPGKDWKEKTLNEVCDLKSGTTISKNLEKKEGDLIYAKIGDMNLLGNEKYITSSSRFSDSNKVNKNQIIPIGSIIFPKRGGAIFTNKRRVIIKPAIVDLNTMALVPLDVIDSEFLYYWFLTIDLKDLNNGSTIPQINNYSFDNMLIHFPESIQKQKQIVKKLNQLSEKTQQLEILYKQKIESIKELKKSILQKAFSGGL